MPSKNVIKQYAENGYYHIYNRGVEKRDVFVDDQDKGVFLSYLRDYLSPKEIDKLTVVLTNPAALPQEKEGAAKIMRLNNFTNEIDLLAYCLMPNHFHLLIKQNIPRAIEIFMRSLCSRYVQYFNRKYERIGGLFQGPYRAVLVKSEEQLLWLTRYIHRNPIVKSLKGESFKGLSLKVSSIPSSYKNYLDLISQSWVKPAEILSYFSKGSGFKSYKTFVEDENSDVVSSGYITDVELDSGD